jgi:hypothetical protein
MFSNQRHLQQLIVGGLADDDGARSSPAICAARHRRSPAMIS